MQREMSSSLVFLLFFYFSVVFLFFHGDHMTVGNTTILDDDPFSFNAATVQRPKGFRRVLSLMLLVTGTDKSSYIVAN
jgi:hypothetical protein